MVRKNNRQELERRVAQSRRLAAEPFDPITQERLRQLVLDLEEQLAKSAPDAQS
jgi:hypothetical protein